MSFLYSSKVVVTRNPVNEFSGTHDGHCQYNQNFMYILLMLFLLRLLLPCLRRRQVSKYRSTLFKLKAPWLRHHNKRHTACLYSERQSAFHSSLIRVNSHIEEKLKRKNHYPIPNNDLLSFNYCSIT